MRSLVRPATATTLDETSHLVKYQILKGWAADPELAGYRAAINPGFTVAFADLRRSMLGILMAVVVSACSSGGATGDRQASRLSQTDAEQLMLRADDVRRSVFDSPQTSRFAGPF